MVITRRTWSSSPLRSNFLVALLSLSLLTLTLNPVSASRGGTEDPSNKFAIGITYRDNGQPQLCSGVLISLTVVATARHCVTSHHGGELTDYEFSNPGKSIEEPVTPNSILKKSMINEDLAFIQLKNPLVGGEPIPTLSREKVLQLVKDYPISGYGFGAVFEEFKLYSDIVRLSLIHI